MFLKVYTDFLKSFLTPLFLPTIIRSLSEIGAAGSFDFLTSCVPKGLLHPCSRRLPSWKISHRAPCESRHMAAKTLTDVAQVLPVEVVLVVVQQLLGVVGELLQNLE